MAASPEQTLELDLPAMMAQRAQATITEVEGSHVVMISQPQAVTDVILGALAGVGQSSTATLRVSA